MNTQTPWQANPEIIQTLKPLPGINYREELANPRTLPDVLTDNAGNPVRTPEHWLRRREEILRILRKEAYGFSPEPPEDMWFDTVLRDPDAIHGAATLKLVDIHLGRKPDAPVIHLKLFIPNNRTKPAPAFLLICNRDPENIDVTRTVKSPFWPVEDILEMGFAIAAFHYADVAPDRKNSFGEPVYTTFEKQSGHADDAWGAISAWAWGASRCMDYFVTDPDIDEQHCAVTGHSRGGKTALWCGAQDTRWALTVSSCSGCSGAALSRRHYGETLTAITRTFDYWFCKNYLKYAGHEETLPFDQHWLLALIAPRALYVHSADEDLWADPKGEWLSLQAAAPVWKLLGRNGLPEQPMPPLDSPAHGDGLAYHIRPGEHNNKREDWLRHAQFFLNEIRTHTP